MTGFLACTTAKPCRYHLLEVYNLVEVVVTGLDTLLSWYSSQKVLLLDRLMLLARRDSGPLCRDLAESRRSAF